MLGKNTFLFLKNMSRDWPGGRKQELFWCGLTRKASPNQRKAIFKTRGTEKTSKRLLIPRTLAKSFRFHLSSGDREREREREREMEGDAGRAAAGRREKLRGREEEKKGRKGEVKREEKKESERQKRKGNENDDRRKRKMPNKSTDVPHLTVPVDFFICCCKLPSCIMVLKLD